MSLPPLADLNVMLVDDDAFQLKLLGAHLRQLGAQNLHPFTAARGALAALDSLSIDLLLCDLQMPDLDGVELLRHLAQRGFTGQVALVSGEDARILRTVEMLGRTHGLQVLGALPKPVAYADVQALLQRWPTGSRKAKPVREPLPLAELQRAIAERELVPHYQPKVELASGRWVGVEALVRWQHPERGMLYPDAFIAQAEEAGLIGELTTALLEGGGTELGVLAQLRQWLDEGLHLHAAVNVSMAMLNDARLPDQIQAQLDAARVPASNLVLEVTESRLMEEARTTLDILVRMRLKRIGLSIDDFGTGHSSLVQLRDVPFGELKVDRSFVHGAHARPDLLPLLKACLQMGHQLGMKTVAEGVEDEADWRHLRSLGCDVAQGYFIGRPMPAAQLKAWAMSWEAQRAALTD
jgi:EAL domain-containing protein (putative c-di-GMP-specific phosphodiesterase class I)/CheY-like chemotaxis protein